MYQRKVDVDMLNAVKSVLADISSIIALRQSKDLNYPDLPTFLSRHKLGQLNHASFGS